MTTQRGFRLATSIGGTLTDRGGNVLIIDDPMKPQDARSQVASDSTIQWYSSTLLTRLDDKSTGAIVSLCSACMWMTWLGGCLNKRAGPS